MITDIIILALLNQGPKHGYEISKHVATIMRRSRGMNNNLLYPALHRLEKMGAIRGKVQRQEGKPNRRVYSIASSGSEILHDLVAAFDEADAAKDGEFQVRLAFFDLLEEADRERILSLRRHVLEENLEHRASIGSVYGDEFHSPWIERLLAFQARQLQTEIAWLRDLQKVNT